MECLTRVNTKNTRSLDRNRAAKGGGRGGRGTGKGWGESKYVHTCMYIYMYVMYNITERIYMNMHMYV